MEEDTYSSSFSKSADMVTNGNVVLIVGHEKLHIRVTSHFLCEISDVFNAMLNGNFAEGISLRNQSELKPTSIPLPGDSGRAIDVSDGPCWDLE